MVYPKLDRWERAHQLKVYYQQHSRKMRKGYVFILGLLQAEFFFR